MGIMSRLNLGRRAIDINLNRTKRGALKYRNDIAVEMVQNRAASLANVANKAKKVSNRQLHKIKLETTHIRRQSEIIKELWEIIPARSARIHHAEQLALKKFADIQKIVEDYSKQLVPRFEELHRLGSTVAGADWGSNLGEKKQRKWRETMRQTREVMTHIVDEIGRVRDDIKTELSEVYGREQAAILRERQLLGELTTSTNQDFAAAQDITTRETRMETLLGQQDQQFAQAIAHLQYTLDNDVDPPAAP